MARDLETMIRVWRDDIYSGDTLGSLKRANALIYELLLETAAWKRAAGVDTPEELTENFKTLVTMTNEFIAELGKLREEISN